MEKKHRQTVPEAIVELMPWLRLKAWSLAKNKDDADDLTQETLLKALEAADRFDEIRSLKPWLLVIMTNTYFVDCKKKKRVAKWEDSYNNYMISMPNMEAKDLLEKILKIAETNIAVMQTVEVALGFSNKLIAQKWNIPNGTLNRRVSDVRHKFLPRLMNDEQYYRKLGRKPSLVATRGMTVPA